MYHDHSFWMFQQTQMSSKNSNHMWAVLIITTISKKYPSQFLITCFMFLDIIFPFTILSIVTEIQKIILVPNSLYEVGVYSSVKLQLIDYHNTKFKILNFKISVFS